MSKKETEIYNFNAVIIGNFNPVIITPQWMLNKGLIRETEAENAKVIIIHPEICRFELDWLIFEASQTRIDFKTKSESHFEILRDLIISIFSALRETPLVSFGLNHLRHYTLRNTEEYINFGYWFSPVNQFENVLRNPKLLNITFLEQGDIDKTDQGRYRVTISPSDLISDSKSIMININHHVENIPNGEAKHLINKLAEIWESSFNKVDEINSEIWNKVQL
ncbi:hypothetical protein [Flavobacterium beibuense]|uniref:TIGR04255 family protein n=1 Tax=Flavobacterium beibuense TaxID=657326 RepID=A0A444WFA1_9FLAO|nr:hypothetical protein [Flavobacterium beibuense]RYJ44523.1 hypothetical protein NU09_1133 [Flavobacterium beibuense]